MKIFTVLLLILPCLFCVESYEFLRADDDEPIIVYVGDDQSGSQTPSIISQPDQSAPDVEVISAFDYPNYINAQIKLNAALGTDQPLIITSQDNLQYGPLTNKTRDNYLSALNYFHQFYTTDIPVTVDATVDTSNEIVSTIQHMIDLCINNLTWLSNNILDALFNRQKAKADDAVFVITDDQPQPTVHDQPEIRRPYIDDHNNLLKLGGQYDATWLKPTEQFINKSWKPQLYDQFTTRRDALLIFTSSVILSKLADVSSKLAVSQQEYDHARQIVIDAESRLKPYTAQSTIAFEQMFNVLNGGSTYTAKDIWNNIHRAFAYISYHMQDQIANQMILDTSLFADPKNSSFDPKEELNKLISSSNPNITKLVLIQTMLQDTANAFNCLGCYTATKPLACSCASQNKEAITYSSDAQAGDDSAFAQVANINVSAITNLTNVLNEARSSQTDFSTKILDLTSTKVSTWLSNHLQASASFLSAFYNQQQGKRNMEHLQLPTLPLLSNYETLKNTLTASQTSYEQAAYDYNEMLVKTGTATNINGQLVPESWIAYARDANVIYDALTSIDNKLFIMIKNLLNELESIKQSSDNDDIQASWQKIVVYAQQFDQSMQHIRSTPGYAACNPFPWYESLITTMKETAQPLTAYCTKTLAGPFWQTKIEASCSKDKGCDDQGLNFVLYAQAIQNMYPYLSDASIKTINQFMSTSAGRLLNNAQNAFSNAQNVDVQYQQQRADAEKTTPVYTENAQALSVWESAAKAAQFAIDYATDATRTQAITLYFTCMNAYLNSNIVRMHADYLVRQIQITYTKYAEAKKLAAQAPKQETAAETLTQLQNLLQPLWQTALTAAQTYQASAQKLTTEDAYNSALKNLDVLASIQTLIQQLRNTSLIVASGAQYSVPLLPSLETITLPDASIMQTRAQLYQNYGMFMFKQALAEQWDANGTRKLITHVTYTSDDIVNKPQSVLSQFVPIKLQKAASAFNQARLFYQKASTTGTSSYAQLDTLNSLSTLAFSIFNTELTSTEPIAPTNEFNAYVPQDMSGKIYTRYILPSWIIPIPDDIYTSYQDYISDTSTYPDIVADTLIENCGGLTDISDADRTKLRTEYINALNKLIKDGTPTQDKTYKLSIFVGQYGASANSYALFINNYPTLPMTTMNMLNTTALETKSTLAIEGYIVGINRLAQYIALEKRVPNGADYTFIQDFITNRKAHLTQLCKSAQPSAAYMLYKQATYLTGSPLKEFEKQLLGIQTQTPLKTPLASIKSLDKDGQKYYTDLQNSSLKNLFANAKLFALAAQDPIANVALSKTDNAQLAVKTDELQQYIMQQYITFLQKYLVGDPAADNYQALSADIQQAFAELAQIYKTSQNDSGSKTNFRILYDQQVQQFLSNAWLNETDVQNKNYFAAANNLFMIVNLYDQYKINLTSLQREIASKAGLTAIHYLFKGAAEKFMHWYENRTKAATASGCETFQTDLLDALIYYGLVSALTSTDSNKTTQSTTNPDPCNQQQGDDRISFYRKIFGINVPCPLPDTYKVCKRSKTDCKTKDPQFQENNLLDGASPDVNDYLCTYLKDTCDSDWSGYVFNKYVKETSPNSQELKKMLTTFVDERLPYALQRSGNIITITGSSNFGVEQSLAALQRWATRILSMIFGMYAETVCKSKESDTQCRVNETTNLANALAARKTAFTQSMSQLFRGSGTITCSTTGGR